jgi:hypothetical protein
MDSTDNFILERLGPCGIHCGKCFAFSDGAIRKSGLELKTALGNFDVYAQRFVDLIDEPVFKKYPDFKELLTYFTTVECKGCRKEMCKLFKDCRVRDCHKEKNVDFCFQCADFPCDHTGFDSHLHKRSVDINNRMKDIGIEKYYEEIKDKPRY